MLKSLISKSQHDEFEFGGAISYVMNASELSNANLADLLEQRGPQSYTKNARSRNGPTGTNGESLKSVKAGQSIASFFNTKTHATFASSTMAEAARAEIHKNYNAVS